MLKKRGNKKRGEWCKNRKFHEDKSEAMKDCELDYICQNISHGFGKSKVMRVTITGNY